MGDVFNGYENLLNGTSNVVAPNLNIGLEILNFQIANTSIMTHFHCFETFVYVLVTHVIFQ
jgi:hypothetical protein